MSVDKTLNNLMLASIEMLLEAGKQGQSSVEIEFDPAKDFGIDTQKGKFHGDYCHRRADAKAQGGDGFCAEVALRHQLIRPPHSQGVAWLVGKRLAKPY